jgi:hypothetical protein
MLILPGSVTLRFLHIPVPTFLLGNALRLYGHMGRLLGTQWLLLELDICMVLAY